MSDNPYGGTIVLAGENPVHPSHPAATHTSTGQHSGTTTQNVSGTVAAGSLTLGVGVILALAAVYMIRIGRGTVSFGLVCFTAGVALAGTTVGAIMLGIAHAAAGAAASTGVAGAG